VVPSGMVKVQRQVPSMRGIVFPAVSAAWAGWWKGSRRSTKV
jgi:hypothetical protein